MIEALLNDAYDRNFSFCVKSEGIVDYTGTNVDDAIEAINAVDECELVIFDDMTDTNKGWAFIVNDGDEDERIADCGAGDWIDKWMEGFCD